MVKEQVNECMEALHDTLSHEYPSTNYSLDGYREDAVCLQESDGKWIVYVGYRNQKDDLKIFLDIVEACLEMIRILTGGNASQNTISSKFLCKIAHIWDEDYTKVTPEEKESLERADKENAMVITEEKKQHYIESVHNEMRRRGLTDKEIPIVIAKTGFMTVMQEYPEEQMHYDVSDAVDEIMLTAAIH